jgi:PAS domain S-box-containing protein
VGIDEKQHVMHKEYNKQPQEERGEKIKGPVVRENQSDYREVLEAIEDGYWEVDLGGKITFCTNTFARILGYTQKELVGMNYLNFMDNFAAKEVFRVFNSVFHSGKPSKTGAYELIRKDGQRIVCDVSVTLILDDEGKPRGFRGILRDITEHRHTQELQERFNLMRRMLGQTIHALSIAFELRDPFTAGHHRRVSDLSRSIATQLKLSRDAIDGIRISGSIHDIGKISIPSEILNKPGKLSNIEFMMVKTHPEIGYNILKNIDFPWPVAQTVHQHHERIDGSGYPQGLTGNEIIMEARIMAVADVVEAMASHRPYRRAIGITEALNEVETNKGILYDRDVADACLDLFRARGYKLKE